MLVGNNVGWEEGVDVGSEVGELVVGALDGDKDGMSVGNNVGWEGRVG